MEEEAAPAVHPHLAVRLGLGLAQGIALYVLIEAFREHVWPATQPALYSALTFVSVYVPLLFIQGLGTVRQTTLLVWCAVAVAACASLGWYSAWRAPDAVFLSRTAALLALAPGLFIAHALITGGDIDRRFMASYLTHFDVAWKLALQLVLVALFEGAFWLLLLLGALLFDMIGLHFLRELIRHDWFIYPATALVVAGGIHLTDMQSGIVRGLRNLVLVLFSWLLPLMTVLAVAFLVALFFTGLEPLWRTGHASAELLSAAGVLVVLINAMFQDGRNNHPGALRCAAIAAAITLVPLVQLAGYALVLRVQQYGWTAERVYTASAVLVAGFYAIGYAVSVALPGGALKLIERWNFAASLVVLAVLLCLFSPVLDPARIAVNSQVARLELGRVAPDKFDFWYLKREGLRFGNEALARLSHSSNPEIRRHAVEAQKQLYQPLNPAPLTAGALANIPVYPKGKNLPVSFVGQRWTRDNGGLMIANCAHIGNPNPGLPLGIAAPGKHGCEAVVADFDGDEKDDVLLISLFSRYSGGSTEFFSAELFRADTAGGWHNAASLEYPHCKGDLEALRTGKVTLAPSGHSDLLLNGRRTQLNWIESRGPCPK